MEWADPNIDADYDALITLIVRGLRADRAEAEPSNKTSPELMHGGRGLLRRWPVVLWPWPSRPACLFVQ